MTLTTDELYQIRIQFDLNARNILERCARTVQTLLNAQKEDENKDLICKVLKQATEDYDAANTISAKIESLIKKGE